jgi:hypothetical protein
MKREHWPWHGDSALGHHSPASRLLKQRVKSGSQGMARMPQSNGRSKLSSAWSSKTYPKPPPNGLYPTWPRGILNSKGELWLSDSCLLKYQAQLLGGTKITLRTCQSLNPASLLPEAEGNPEHSCEEMLKENYAARPDLTDQPLKNPDLPKRPKTICSPSYVDIRSKANTTKWLDLEHMIKREHTRKVWG